MSLTDRVWFKVKTSDRRAAVTELPGVDLPDWVRPSRGAWWIGAAGRRQADSAQRDFYATLQRACTTGKTVSSDHLLPAEWDWKRLAAEQAVAWRREMKSIVIRLVAMSLKGGSLAVAEFRNHRIKALVRAENGHEAPEDWQPEPSPLAEMNPGSGEIIWSTLFPSEIASEILELDVDD